MEERRADWKACEGPTSSNTFAVRFPTIVERLWTIRTLSWLCSCSYGYGLWGIRTTTNGNATTRARRESKIADEKNAHLDVDFFTERL